MASHYSWAWASLIFLLYILLSQGLVAPLWGTVFGFHVTAPSPVGLDANFAASLSWAKHCHAKVKKQGIADISAKQIYW